jgi:hypothetical protein
MKKQTILLLFFATLLSSLIATLPIPARADDADFISFPSGVTVYSPLNMTYDSRYLTLNVTLQSAGNMGDIDPNVWMSYGIDGKTNGAVPLDVSNPGLHVVTNAAGLVNLPELSPGSHCLTITTYGHNQKTLDPKYLSFTDTVYFSISADASSVPPPGWILQDSTPQDSQPQDLTPQDSHPQDSTPPTISILSPTENGSFQVTNPTSFAVPLNFTVDESSQLSLSLDGQLNTTINGNLTLTGLLAGLHNVTLYACDSAGNVGASETVNFSITATMEPQQEPDSSLVLPLAASAASVAVVASGVLVYLRKHKS